MNVQLQDKLFKLYPKIFTQKDLPAQHSAMAFGIACPDEWYDLINVLCRQIQSYIDFKKEKHYTCSVVSTS